MPLTIETLPEGGTPPSGPPPFRNRLLAGLSDNDLDILRPHLARVGMVAGQTLLEPGEPVDHVFFIESGVVSLMADTGDDGAVEVGMTGREGVVGASAILTLDAVGVHRAVVQTPGSALRMRVAALRDAVDRCPSFRDRCLRFADCLIVQASQSAACNARHDLTQRLARWLLSNRDRVDGDAMPMTQDVLAAMLGVRRSGVSLTARALQSAGAIRQSRGRITVLDRVLLEARACSCYRIVESRRRRIMGPAG